MKKLVLVINSGSSSLKFQLIDMSEHVTIAKGLYERIGLENPSFSLTYQGEKVVEACSVRTHSEAVYHLRERLEAEQILASFDDLIGIGHRVAHGGPQFKTAVVIDDEVERQIEELSQLAPLHNPINLVGIKAFKELVPGVMEVAVFDTAFHQTMDRVHQTYPIAQDYCDKYAIRRYGFHGISHQFIRDFVADYAPKSQKVISTHLGNGSSICGMLDGKSYVTSMGFTPLAGLMMGTRCGDVDPAILPFLAKKENLSMDELEGLLNQSSGLLGVSGLSSDLRDILSAAQDGHEPSQLALDLFIERIYATIGAYVAELNGLDTLVFTAGIGENSPEVREGVCRQLEYLGLKLDTAKNERGELLISSPDSKVCVLVVPTNEELMIAKQVYALA